VQVTSSLLRCRRVTDKSQINRLQQIQQSLACTADKALNYTHSWIVYLYVHTISKRIEYKQLISLTCKVLTTSQSTCLIYVQCTCRTRSSSAVTLAWPSVSSSLQIANRCFRCAKPKPYLWNQLPPSFRQPHSVHSPHGSPYIGHFASPQSLIIIIITSAFTLTICHSPSLSLQKTHLFHKKSGRLSAFSFFKAFLWCFIDVWHGVYDPVHSPVTRHIRRESNTSGISSWESQQNGVSSFFRTGLTAKKWLNVTCLIYFTLFDDFSFLMWLSLESHIKLCTTSVRPSVPCLRFSRSRKAVILGRWKHSDIQD